MTRDSFFETCEQSVFRSSSKKQDLPLSGLDSGTFRIEHANVFQRSKLTFSKSRLLATFNCKMVAIKKIWSPKKNSLCPGRTLRVCYMRVYFPERHFCNTFLAKLLHLLACRLKYCSNGQDKEKEETPMSGSRNDFYKAAETG